MKKATITLIGVGITAGAAAVTCIVKKCYKKSVTKKKAKQNAIDVHEDIERAYENAIECEIDPCWKTAFDAGDDSRVSDNDNE